jgi:hypothetical protein
MGWDMEARYCFREAPSGESTVPLACKALVKERRSKPVPEIDDSVGISIWIERRFEVLLGARGVESRWRQNYKPGDVWLYGTRTR